MPSFFINHENNNLNEYTGTILNGGGAISTSAGAAMGGTNYGLQSTVGAAVDQGMAYLNFTAFDGDGYIVTLWFDPNSIVMPTVNPTDWSNKDVTIMRITNQALGTAAFFLFIELQYNGSNYVVRACIADDALSFNCTSDITINNVPQFFQIIVTKSSSAIANDGTMKFYINGTLKSTASNIDLFTRYALADVIRVGLDDNEVGISGTCYYDEIGGISYSGSTPTATDGKLKTPDSFIDEQGAGAAGGAGGGSNNVADISADGLNIYISAFNDLGFPTLIKIATALSANGSVVFNPSAGGRVGVQCGDQDEDVVWVTGLFDGTNTVEKSEDAGSSFTVKDDGTFGAIRSFKVGPNDDDRIIVFDGDNGDIIESLDSGETWTVINASVTPLINSIARFGKNPEEIVIGNQGDATNSINYSPNSGANLEDYQTGVYPNANTTKVIVG